MVTEAKVDAMALGKNMGQEPTHGMDRVELPRDGRSAEDVGAADKSTGPSVEELLASGAINEGTDPKEIERLMGLTIPDKDQARAAEAAAPATNVDPLETAPVVADPVVEAAKPAEQAPTAAEAAKAAEVVAEAQGVLARDGKNVLPYAVLKGTREQNTKLQQQLQELAEHNKALQEQLAAQQAGTAAPAQTDEAAAVPGMSDDELAQLTETLPDPLANAIKALVMNSRQTQQQLEELQGRQQQEDTARKQTLAETVQEAIDAHPDLRAWQASEDQTLWTRAKQFDSILRTDPEWRDKTMVERFEHVAFLVSGKTRTPAAPTTPSLAEQAAAAVVRKTAGAAAVPITHSDLPAGTPAAQSERDRIESLDNAGLERLFASGKTVEDVIGVLAKIA